MSVSEGSFKSQEYLQMKEVDDEISKIERKLAHVSKSIALRYQKEGIKIEVDDTEIDEADFEKGLMDYFEASEQLEQKRTKQAEINERLLNELNSVKHKHEIAREDLKRTLLGIYFSTRPKVDGKKSRRASLSNQVQSEALDKLFEEQKIMEDKVLKLRLKMYVIAQHAQQEQDPQVTVFKRELKMLEQQMRQEILKKKLSVVQNLLSRQINIKDGLIQEGGYGNSSKNKVESKIAMLKSDNYMSELALKQMCQRYKNLQLHHEALWNKINEAKISGELVILASIDKQHSMLLSKLDEEIRAERINCEKLDKLLTQYSQ